MSTSALNFSSEIALDWLEYLIVLPLHSNFVKPVETKMIKFKRNRRTKIKEIIKYILVWEHGFVKYTSSGHSAVCSGSSGCGLIKPHPLLPPQIVL